MYQLYWFASKLPWLPAFADYQKFQFVAAGHVCTAEDCYFIHSFLPTDKLLKREAQRAIWCRSVTHASLISVVDVFMLVLAQKLK